MLGLHQTEWRNALPGQEKLRISGIPVADLSHRKMPSSTRCRIENATGGEVKPASFVTGAM